MYHRRKGIKALSILKLKRANVCTSKLWTTISMQMLCKFLKSFSKNFFYMGKISVFIKTVSLEFSYDLKGKTSKDFN